MKKILLVVFVLGIVQLTQAQIDFGIKAGVNYNSDAISSFKDVTTEYNAKAEGKLGYHAGIWTRFNLPVTGLYIRPELVYTALKSEVTIQNTNPAINSTDIKADYDFQKVDIPVLIGYKFGDVVSAFIGPSFQYIIDSDFKWDQVKEVKNEDFTVGLQVGAGVEFGKLGVDVRWERGFSDNESELIGNNVGENLRFDTRVNQIIFGLSYKF